MITESNLHYFMLTRLAEQNQELDIEFDHENGDIYSKLPTETNPSAKTLRELIIKNINLNQEILELRKEIFMHIRDLDISIANRKWYGKTGVFYIGPDATNRRIIYTIKKIDVQGAIKQMIEDGRRSRGVGPRTKAKTEIQMEDHPELLFHNRTHHG